MKTDDPNQATSKVTEEAAIETEIVPLPSDAPIFVNEEKQTIVIADLVEIHPMAIAETVLRFAWSVISKRHK